MRNTQVALRIAYVFVVSVDRSVFGQVIYDHYKIFRLDIDTINVAFWK